MANVKISELTALTPPDAADLVPVTDSSASQTKRTTVGAIVGIINGDVDVTSDGTATASGFFGDGGVVSLQLLLTSPPQQPLARCQLLMAQRPLLMLQHQPLMSCWSIA